MAESYIPNPIGSTASILQVKSVGSNTYKVNLLLDFPSLKIVYINGLVEITTAMSAGTLSEVLAVMPSHIRPSYGQHMQCNRTDGGSADCNFFIGTTGNVHMIALAAIPGGVNIVVNGWIYYG